MIGTDLRNDPECVLVAGSVECIQIGGAPAVKFPVVLAFQIAVRKFLKRGMYGVDDHLSIAFHQRTQRLVETFGKKPGVSVDGVGEGVVAQLDRAGKVNVEHQEIGRDEVVVLEQGVHPFEVGVEVADHASRQMVCGRTDLVDVLLML